jgi:predicted kinase
LALDPLLLKNMRTARVSLLATGNWQLRDSTLMSSSPECVLLIGLPGAGKSRFYRTYFGATHILVSKDALPAGARSAARLRQMISEALSTGGSLVVDNTNPTAAERVAIIDAARAQGVRIVGYFFDVTTRQAIARNAERTGAMKVPNVAIFTTAKKLERPTLLEGYDQLFRIRLLPDRQFTVEEIVPE